MSSSLNRRHGFGIGLVSITLTLGNLTLALFGHWLDPLLLYGASGLAFAVILSQWSERQGERASIPAPTRLALSRSVAGRIAALFHPHVH